MKECLNECLLNGKVVENNVLYDIEMSIEILRYSMDYGKDETLHAQALQSVNSEPESTDLTHEDTITIKHLEDVYASATDSLITELDLATTE